jgi:hypothetical protein
MFDARGTDNANVLAFHVLIVLQLLSGYVPGGWWCDEVVRKSRNEAMPGQDDRRVSSTLAYVCFVRFVRQ